MQSAEGSRIRATAREAAFADFYRRHSGAVLAYVVRRIDDRETAREIALDVFRIAWGSFGSDQEPTRSWLLGVARNRIGDAYRARDREWRLRAAMAAEAAAPTRPDGERIRDVLSSLPDATREVLVLTYWDGLRAPEVGQLIGCSTAAVWVRLHRARRAFAAAWEEDG